ncbi:MAG: ABC transporter substrate-binding protein [Sulfobacillus thermosulfidooxidans]|uniref:ABC transporter substrate-binding protein n=1 Tax=Sulfobacillus thermosulfidooxidans TaxID=28034 RepID=A0A2T2WTT5_SULTH|nr:MAG: ABC transporter substrate-binding protein [Sulfobacillus thermosulfidooxidans]
MHGKKLRLGCKRRWVWTSTASLIFLVAGCGTQKIAASASHSTPAPQIIDITYWAGHDSGALHQAVVAEVTQFNHTHPYIHVTFKAIGASKHGLAAFESGQAPNVGMVSGYIVPQLAQSGAILKLGPYVNGPNGLSSVEIQRRYYPIVWKDMFEPNGTQYEMPLEKKSLLVIYYNESLFKEAGITHPPTTWAQVGADAARITHLGPDYHGIAWTPSLSQFFDMTIADGGRVFPTKTNRRSFVLNNAGAFNALTTLRSWVANGSMILTSGYQYQVDFGTGKVGMVIDASAGYTYDKRSVGHKFLMGAIAAPQGSSGHSSQYINGASLVLFNTGSNKQKDAAWTFMKWLSSPATNVYWNEQTNYLPLGPQAYTMMKSFYRAHPAQAASFIPPSQWWFKPRTANYEAAKTAMESPFYKALSGTLSITAALNQMDEVGTRYLSGQVRG